MIRVGGEPRTYSSASAKRNGRVHGHESERHPTSDGQIWSSTDQSRRRLPVPKPPMLACIGMNPDEKRIKKPAPHVGPVRSMRPTDLVDDAENQVVASIQVRPNCHQEDSWPVVESLLPLSPPPPPQASQVAPAPYLSEAKDKADFEAPLTFFALPLPTASNDRI